MIFCYLVQEVVYRFGISFELRVIHEVISTSLEYNYEPLMIEYNDSRLCPIYSLVLTII